MHAYRALTTDDRYTIATIATTNEMWDLAKVLYEEILALDPNIIEIKKNLQTVNERINLVSKQEKRNI